MSKENSRKKLKSIISEITGIDGDKINHDSDFNKDLGADSLDVVELLIDVEDAFDIRFDWKNIGGHNISTIADIERILSIKNGEDSI